MGDTASVLVGVAEITLGVGVDAKVIGYTVDGVNMTTRSSFADIKVDENEGTLIRKLIDQEVTITLNVAEGALTNLTAAIPGSSINVGGDIVIIGGSDLQEHRLTLRGITPAGRDRVIVLTSVNPTGEVTTPYKKGEISVVPMTFSALVDDDGEFGSVLDAATVPPEFDSATTSVDGKEIDITFDVNMGSSADKYNEFWFTRNGTAYAFDSASTSLKVITLTIPAVNKVLNGETVEVSYRLGTVLSAAGGVLGTFIDEECTNAAT